MDRTILPASIRAAALVLLGSLALLWPALVNGGPFWFPDTSNYVRAADAAVVYATGQRSEWSDRLVVVSPEAATDVSRRATAQSRARQIEPTRPVYAGRSIYYGFFLYVPMVLIGSWGAILVQSLITTGILFLVGRIVTRELGRPTFKEVLGISAVLVVATPLPFYVSMLMPDVYAGLLILTLGTALPLFDRITSREKWALLLASALFATFHTTHLLIAGAMGAAALLLSFFSRLRLRAALLTVPVIIVGVTSILGFNFAVQAALDEKPFSPPFLSARITAAGPGTDYLRRNCTESAEPFLLCRYRERLPLESDSFLWSEEPETGLFQLMERGEQLTVASEDRKFFLAVLADDPLGFARAALSASLEQLFDFDLENFNYPDWRAEALFEKYPQRVAAAIATTRAVDRTMPTAPFVWLSAATTLLGLGIVATVFVQQRIRRQSLLPPDLWRLVALVLAGVLANAIICGALSGPHARYQMRLIWIVPFAASLVFLGVRSAISRRPAA